MDLVTWLRRWGLMWQKAKRLSLRSFKRRTNGFQTSLRSANKAAFYSLKPVGIVTFSRASPTNGFYCKWFSKVSCYWCA